MSRPSPTGYRTDLGRVLDKARSTTSSPAADPQVNAMGPECGGLFSGLVGPVAPRRPRRTTPWSGGGPRCGASAEPAGQPRSRIIKQGYSETNGRFGVGSGPSVPRFGPVP